MIAQQWQSFPAQWQDDKIFLDRIVAIHREIYEQFFAKDLLVNHQLEIDYRSFRRVNEWRILLIVSPWMLARLFVPDINPGITIPANWSASERRDKAYMVLGPALKLDLLPGRQQAHLNYHHEIGHYCLQPLALNMSNYKCADEAFVAWNQVIKTRNENMEKYRHECSWHKDISRREFFNRFQLPE